MSKLIKEKVRDFGLVAYFMVKGFRVNKNEDNCSYIVSISDAEFETLTADYCKTIKPLLSKIRQLLKEISVAPPLNK